MRPWRSFLRPDGQDVVVTGQAEEVRAEEVRIEGEAVAMGDSQLAYKQAARTGSLLIRDSRQRPTRPVSDV